MIKDTIRANMISAMRAKDKKAKDTYAYMLDQIQKAEKSRVTIDNPNPVLSEAEIMGVIQELVKQSRDAIVKTRKAAEGKKTDITGFISDKEAEISIYMQFLPEEMTADEIMVVIRETADAITGNINKGVLMKNILPKVKGKADNRLVVELVDKFLTDVK